MKKKTVKPETIIRIVSVTLAVLLFAFLGLGLLNLSRKQDSLGKDALKTAVMRSVMACYAAEGVYPENLEYIKENYGLTYDENKYTVKYDIFAQNLMPDISVLEK